MKVIANIKGQKFHNGRVFIEVSTVKRSYLFKTYSRKQHQMFVDNVGKKMIFWFDAVSDKNDVVKLDKSQFFNKEVDEKVKAATTRKMKAQSSNARETMESERKQMGSKSKHSSLIARIAEQQRERGK